MSNVTNTSNVSQNEITISVPRNPNSPDSTVIFVPSNPSGASATNDVLKVSIPTNIIEVLTDMNEEIKLIKETLLHGRTLNAKDYAPGDGTDQTAQLTALFNEAKDGDTLYFPSGHYKMVATGYAYTFQNKKALTIQGTYGSVLEVTDNGLQFQACDGLKVDGITLVRTTQGAWSLNRIGIRVLDSNNVTISHNDISKFTDAINVVGTVDDTKLPFKNIFIHRNILHELGEEPIVILKHIIHAVITENDCSRHLGDGILLKGSWYSIIEKNFIHTPITEADPNYLVFSNNNPAGGIVPRYGGGITCNTETGEDVAKGVTIRGNTVLSTGYGVILLGFYGAIVESNHFKNVGRATSVISVSYLDSVYNPNGKTNYLFTIIGNHIENLTNASITSAIEARTQAGQGMDFGVISNNIINVNGKHYGIRAEGNVSVTGNYVGNAGIGLVLSRGVIATSNVIRGSFDTASPDAHAFIYDDVTFTNNSIVGKGSVTLKGKNSLVIGNRIEYQGGWWAVFFDVAGTTPVENNIVRDNIIRITGTGAGKYIFGSDGNGIKTKNILVDTETFSGVFGYALQDIILKSSDNKRWKIVAGTGGTLTATQI